MHERRIWSSRRRTRRTRALAEEAAVGGRIDWRLHDIAEDPEAVEQADIVVPHRVVCCYPNYERLLGAAADHARRALVFSYPPRNAPSRAFYASSPGRAPRPPGPVEVAE